jgi:hypothetical protein
VSIQAFLKSVLATDRFWRKAAVGIFANKLDAGCDSGERVVKPLAGRLARKNDYIDRVARQSGVLL